MCDTCPLILSLGPHFDSKFSLDDACGFQFHVIVSLSIESPDVFCKTVAPFRVLAISPDPLAPFRSDSVELESDVELLEFELPLPSTE